MSTSSTAPRGRGVPASETDAQSRVAGSSPHADALPRSVFDTAHGPLLLAAELVEERIETPFGVLLRVGRRAEPAPAEPALWIA